MIRPGLCIIICSSLLVGSFAKNMRITLTAGDYLFPLSVIFYSHFAFTTHSHLFNSRHIHTQPVHNIVYKLNWKTKSKISTNDKNVSSSLRLLFYHSRAIIKFQILLSLTVSGFLCTFTTRLSEKSNCTQGPTFKKCLVILFKLLF